MFCKQMDIPNHSYHSLLQFRVEVANGLLLAKKTREKAVGQPKKINFSPTLKVCRVPVEVKPLICAAIVLTTGPKSVRNETDTACVQHWVVSIAPSARCFCLSRKTVTAFDFHQLWRVLPKKDFVDELFVKCFYFQNKNNSNQNCDYNVLLNMFEVQNQPTSFKNALVIKGHELKSASVSIHNKECMCNKKNLTWAS